MNDTNVAQRGSCAVSGHILSRLLDRLPEDEAYRIYRKALATAARITDTSAAVRIARLRGFGNRVANDDSNGDTIVIIVRQRTLVTLMYRRSTQDFDATSMRVDATYILRSAL